MQPVDIAAASLRANILTLPSGKYVTAGQNQFLTLWTRDFCHAVRGLLAIGEDEVVKNHLGYLLKSLRKDGLVPRVVDNHIVQFRVVYQSARKLLPFMPKLSFKEPLRPQYVDEHGSHAVDSNLLLILACIQVYHRPGGKEFWNLHELQLRKVWQWYHGRFHEGLITQTAFADWQDSAKREGKAFLTNLFYFLAATRLRQIGWNVDVNLEEFKQKIQSKFFNQEQGIFMSLEGYPQVSVEGNLFALETSDFLNDEQRKNLWAALKNHSVVAMDGVIGRCGYPNWPIEDQAFHFKIAHLNHYHGDLTWSWLMGLGLKVCKIMKDENMIIKQMDHVTRLLERDQVVIEVYDPEKDFEGWGSKVIQAERPFAWGSGYLVEALLV